MSTEARSAVERCAAHAERAWRYASSLTLNAADAEDAVSDAFVVAAQTPHKVPIDDSWPWFCAVISNVVRNMRRKRRPTMQAELPEPVSARPSPAELAQQSEMGSLLKRELARLDEPDREALCAVFVAGLSQAQAASALGVPTGTVATRVRRAQQQLRERLRKDDDETRAAFAFIPFGIPAGGMQAAARRWKEHALSQGHGSVKGTAMSRIALLVCCLVAAFAVWFFFLNDATAAKTQMGLETGDGSTTDAQPLELRANSPRKETAKENTGKPSEEPAKKPENVGYGTDVRDSRVLRVTLGAEPYTFDPHASGDSVSASVCSLVYETLLEDDPFLPGALRPLLLTDLPVLGSDSTCTLRLRDDIYFTSHESFKGRRKLVAADVAWSLKRAAISNNSWLIEGRIAGIDQSFCAVKAANAAERMALADREVEGLRVIDDRTLKVTVRGPWTSFLQALANPGMAIMAREAVAKLGETSAAAMVGTGPYTLVERKPGHLLVFARNKEYREVRLSGVPADSMLKRFEGEKLPLCGRIEFALFGDYDSMYNDVIDGKLDFLRLNVAQANWVIDWDAPGSGKTGEPALQPALRGKGVDLRIKSEPVLDYLRFNMNDPIVGAPAGEKGLAIRRALSLSIDRAKFCLEHMKSRGTPANQVMPPKHFGHLEGTPQASQRYDLKAARKILESAGFIFEFRDGAEVALDEAGKPITLELITRNNELGKNVEFYAACAAAAGITLKASAPGFAEYLRKSEAGEGQIFDCGWVWDDTTPENALQLFYSKNTDFTIGYKSAEFDRLYDELVATEQQGAENRKRKLDLVQRISQALEADTPAVFLNHRRSFILCRKGLALEAGGFERQLKYVAK